jgi:hypothetical protein
MVYNSCVSPPADQHEQQQHTHVHTYTRTHTHTHTHTRTRTHVHTRTYTHTHVGLVTHTYTHVVIYTPLSAGKCIIQSKFVVCVTVFLPTVCAGSFGFGWGSHKLPAEHACSVRLLVTDHGCWSLFRPFTTSQTLKTDCTAAARDCMQIKHDSAGWYPARLYLPVSRIVHTALAVLIPVR